MIAINSMPDHAHIFVGLKPTQSISDLVRDIKTNSSSFITEKKFVGGKFNWQEGFGAFSYSHSQIDAVVKYILEQEVHHKKETFREEYIHFLKKFNVEYDEKYLFDWIE
jgi:REP element-mobilizing transposase RayT